MPTDPPPHPSRTLRDQALCVLLECNPERKAALARAANAGLASGSADTIGEPPGVPGRPARPILVPHTEVGGRSVATVEGRASLLHALAHIELNAIDLAADATWRFSGLPDDYYLDWTVVMQEEALHYQMLVAHLGTLGHAYGDFPAHRALWDMAERTRDDVLARIALVPRTMEARGLDASPAVRAKLASAGDRAAAAIVDRILGDEIGHVRVGNHWFFQLCAARGLEPVAAYADLARRYEAPRLRGPFNLAARRDAGFTAEELAALAAR